MFKIIRKKLGKLRIIEDQKGFSLLEILIAIPMIAILAVALLMSLGTSSKVLIRTSTYERAKDIAISDMDFVMSQTYSQAPGNYQQPPQTNGYVSTITVTDITSSNDTDATWSTGQEEEIDVAISLNGKSLFTLTDYRSSY
jgi:prepilin-type N-terminal cleavage/methylation domain-containing protein